MTGGIWVELMCQQLNNATALVHKGDCSAGTAPKFPPTSVGDRVKVTGADVIDIREGGHAEIHSNECHIQNFLRKQMDCQ